MKSRRFGVFSAGVIIVGALALMVFRWSFASEAVYPVERLVHLVMRPVRSVFSGVSTSAENDRLRREVRTLSLLRGDLDRLQSENARLRRALGYRMRQPGTWISAEVLSAGGGASATHRSIRVDRGSLDGVRKGAVVVVPEGLVGRVTAVSPHTAEVALLSDPLVKVSCEIARGTSVRAHGILSGGESDRLLIRHLSSVESLCPQMRITTSGFGGVFPAGIAVGTLLRVTTDGFREAEGEVLPCVDFSGLEDVFIRCDQ